MPRIRKTSTQPKRKIKKAPKLPEVIYPDYVQNFINEVKEKTPYIVRAVQYSIDSGYQVGVLKQNGKVWHCIWIASYAKTKEELDKFWDIKFE
jgi:hypothetical protein